MGGGDLKIRLTQPAGARLSLAITTNLWSIKSTICIRILTKHLHFASFLLLFNTNESVC